MQDFFTVMPKEYSSTTLMNIRCKIQSNRPFWSIYNRYLLSFNRYSRDQIGFYFESLNLPCDEGYLSFYDEDSPIPGNFVILACFVFVFLMAIRRPL